MTKGRGILKNISEVPGFVINCSSWGLDYVLSVNEITNELKITLLHSVPWPITIFNLSFMPKHPTHSSHNSYNKVDPRTAVGYSHAIINAKAKTASDKLRWWFTHWGSVMDNKVNKHATRRQYAFTSTATARICR